MSSSDPLLRADVEEGGGGIGEGPTVVDRIRAQPVAMVVLSMLMLLVLGALVGLVVFIATDAGGSGSSSSESPVTDDGDGGRDDGDDDDEGNPSETEPTNGPRAATGSFAKAAAAADNAICSQAGADIMQAGGNAVDGAIATAFCLGVLQQFASGIGGGGVALSMCLSTSSLRYPNGTAFHVDFREVAPAAATEDMYNDDPDRAIVGGLSVGVPGEVAGLEYLYKKFGSGNVDWVQLIEPARLLAQNSTVGELLALRLEENEQIVLLMPGLSSIFAPNGTILKEGDVLLQPALAATLDKIAREGAQEYYKGEIAESIVDAASADGGILTMEDMLTYYQSGVVERDVLSWFYQGYEVLGSYPPFAGGVCLAQIMNVLESYNLALLGQPSGLGQHWLVESMKLAFANRMAVGDPQFVDDIDDVVVPAMLSKKHAAYLRQRLSANTTFLPPHYVDLTGNITTQLDDHGTSHISVIDESGMAVALTTTVNTAFGSKILDVNTGIVLNDEMADFSIPILNETNVFGLPPSTSNFVVAGKRPLSSMAPTIILENDELKMVVGGSGGPTIITAVVEVALNVLAWGMDLEQAVSQPRLHNQLTSPTQVELEYPESFKDALRERHHDLRNRSSIASVQAIMIEADGSRTATSDWRKLGKPAGF